MTNETTVPHAVAAAGRNADELIKQLAAGQQTQQQEEPAPQPEAAAPQDTPVAPAPQEQLSDELKELRDSEQRWEHKFRSLQGMMLSKMQPLQRDLAAAQAELGRLKDENTQLRQKAENPPSPLITEQDRSTYGDDMLDTIRRQALEAIQPEIESLRGQLAAEQSRNQQLEQFMASLNNATVATVANSFYDQLDAGCADWEEVNKDPQFIRWLNQYEPLAGTTRHAAMLRAFEAKNANDVLYFFKLWKQQTGHGTPRQDDRQQLVSPPKGAGAPAPAEKKPAGRQWTRAEVSQFYANKARGKYTAEQAAEIERDILAAPAEGRLQ